MPKISVITPCYNSEAFIGRTIESVRSQTFSGWEHIVVDDGSADDSANMVETLQASEPRLRLVRQSNGGVCRARNMGARVCSSESAYLLFLDADDLLEPEMLTVMVDYLDAHPEVGLAHCGHRYIDADDRPIDPAAYGLQWSPRYVPAGLGVRTLPPDVAETPFVSVFTLAGIVPSISVIRRSIYEKTPGWDETFGQHYEDTDLFLHVAIRSKVHFVPRELALHRRHDAQNTADPRRFGDQERKLYAKWRQMSGLTPEQQAMIRAAWRFREGRLIPSAGFAAGTRHLRRGEIGKALRFYGGALHRYLASLLPIQESQGASNTFR